MRRNLATGLRLRCRANPMADYDRLPAPARAWMAQAVLPWSAASVGRIWRRALAETGMASAALDRLARAERQSLAREGRMPPAGPAQSLRVEKYQSTVS